MFDLKQPHALTFELSYSLVAFVTKGTESLHRIVETDVRRKELILKAIASFSFTCPQNSLERKLNNTFIVILF